jgi:hypothetical protein
LYLILFQITLSHDVSANYSSPKSSSSFKLEVGLNNLEGSVVVSSGCFAFFTQWPKDVEIKNIRLDAFFSIKLSDGSSVTIKCDQRNEQEHGLIQQLSIGKDIKLNAELLYDKERCFVVKADLRVTQGDTNDDNRFCG